MEKELIKIFDDNENEIGTATRDDVHKFGYWHEVCHCWFVSQEEDTDYIYIQQRSKRKKEYPNLLDITAAGHLLANETAIDSVREIREELGIQVKFEELIPLGIIKYNITSENYIDKEMANIFMYNKKITFDDFSLQEEEVSGMVRATFQEFDQLWNGKKDVLHISGYEIGDHGEKIQINKNVGVDDFAAPLIPYYQTLIQKIKEYI